MSLDVYLELDEVEEVNATIYIRGDDGRTRAITAAEWTERFPDREPVIAREVTSEVYWGNVTHNLGKMAEMAGLYKYLWRPDEIEITKAKQLIEPLREGLNKLRNNPEFYQRFNPENGWGTYEGLVSFVTEYLSACEANPEAAVRVWR